MSRGRVSFLHLPAEVPARCINYPGFSALGPLTAAGYLERRGFEVRFWEALTSTDEHDAVRPRDGGLLLGADAPSDAVLAELGDAQLVVFPLDMYRHPERAWGAEVARLSHLLKEARPKITVAVADCHVGGVDYVPIDHHLLLEALPRVDCYVRGEPELALADIAEGMPLSEIAGVHTRSEPSKRDFASRIPELDLVPLPAYHLIDVDRYFEAQQALVDRDLVHEYHERGRSLPVMSSRGCPYACTFCATGGGRRYRALSPQVFAEHLARVVSLGASVLFFLDDIMNLEPERFRAILRLLRDAGVRWTPVNGLRADRLDAESIRLFRDSGGFNLKVSAESGDPRVLREIVQKGMDPEATSRVAAAAHAHSVPLMVHYVVGFPGEELSGVNRTLEMAAELHERYGAVPRVQYATPVPGSALHTLARATGLLHADPSRWDLLSAFVSKPLLDMPDLPADLQRLLLTVFRSRADRARDPVLMLDPSYRCNQRCTFCSAAPLRRTPERSLEELHEVITGAVRRGIRRLDLGGGEPTIWPSLAGLVRFARRAGMRDVGIVTNGRMLSYRSVATRLRDAGVSRFVVSAAAHTETIHEALTRTPGAYREMLSGIDAASRLEGVETFLNIVLCRTTAPHLPELVGFFGRRWPVRVINVQVVLSIGGALDSGEAFGSYEEFLPHLARALELERLPPLSVHNIPPCFLLDHPELAMRDGFKGDRIFFEHGDLVRFSDILARSQQKLPHCIECPAYLLCSGVDRGMAPRYECEPQRPRLLRAALARRASGTVRSAHGFPRP